MLIKSRPKVSSLKHREEHAGQFTWARVKGSHRCKVAAPESSYQSKVLE